jgi:hypothetical protein
VTLALHGTSPDRTRISALLTQFYESAAASGLPEMERLATTVSTWWPQILAAITTGITNAASEGINRLIKTDARCAFGYRNPATQRLRARCAEIVADTAQDRGASVGRLLQLPAAAAARLLQRGEPVPAHISAVLVVLAAVALIDPGLGNDLAGLVDLLADVAHISGLRVPA